MITFNKLKKLSKQTMSNGSEPISVALLGDSSTQMLAIALRGMFNLKNLNVDFWEADYNQVDMQVNDSSGTLHKLSPQYLIVFEATHKLLNKYSKMSNEQRLSLAEDKIEFVKKILTEFPSSKLIYLNFPEIDDAVYGSYSNKVEFSFLYQIRKLNYELMKLALAEKNLSICDISSIQNKFGSNTMFYPELYMDSDIVLSLEVLPHISGRIVDIILADKAIFKKCLILDLDNTIWSGVAGEDYVQVGSDLGVGRPFYEFQLWCKKLKERGIILAVCSKNDEALAKEVFLKHSGMILNLEDIAVFIANWNTKVDNIRHIQSILNIGFEAMVFIDDNPFERNMVRKYIPEITVPELPDEPFKYLEFLYAQNLFETPFVAENDDERTLQYQQEAQRKLLKKSFSDEENFLKTLAMKSRISTLDKFNILRVVELSQRSNQFNLRTIRYTQADLENISNSDKYIPMTFTLEDSFGDNGLVCVAILKKLSADELFIEAFFMSCRVLKRGMEDFVLNEIVEVAKKHNIKRIIGEYKQTTKNSIVKDFYDNMGFELDKSTELEKLYSLEVDPYSQRKSYIEKQ